MALTAQWDNIFKEKLSLKLDYLVKYYIFRQSLHKQEAMKLDSDLRAQITIT